MILNEKEQKFLTSIDSKIKKYSISTTTKEALLNSTGNFVETTYNDLSTEIVDAGIEHFLCKKSFLYFMTSYAWVDIPGKGSEPFKPYYFQKELAREIQKYLKVVAFKTRQAGFSTLTSNYAFWKCNFYEGEYISIISKTQIAAQGFVGRFNTTMIRMPDFLKKKVLAQNTEKIVLQHPSGTLSTIRSESQSENAGRGDSISLLIMDEVAHYQSDRMVRKIVSSSGPALTKTGGQLLVISTPSGTSGAGQYYYEQVVNAQISKDKHTKLITIDWWEIPDDPEIAGPKKGYNEILEKAIKENYYHNEPIKSKYNNFFMPLAKEKYYENPWLRRQYEDSNEQSYRQEILHEFIVSGNMVFNKDVLAKIESRIREPIIKNKFKTMEIDGLWIWKEPKPGKRYAISCDIAKGTSADYSTFQIFDVEEYEQVCEYQNLLSTPAFARLIYMLANYYNQAYLIIESNGVGEAVFTKLYYDENESYNNMYKEFKTNKKGEQIATGWTTTEKSRKLITNNLIDWLTVDDLFSQLKIYSKRLYLEMTTWIYNEKGKPTHASSSAHDDLLMALAFCLYLRDRATNGGESFLISESGKMFTFKKDNINDGEEDNFSKAYGFVSDEWDGGDANSEEIKIYNWLIN